MDFAAQSYVAQVDRILAAAVSLFPAESHSGELQRSAAPSGGDLPDGDSGLASAAGEAAGRYRSDDARAVALSDALHSSVAEAVAHAQEANQSAKAISQTAATGARAVLAEGTDPHNLVLLVSQMDERLAAMQEHIEQTRQRLQASAQRITAHGADMSQA
ncbi:hypothetical protein Y900_028430 [Mycolicibacterium aromaticivorans JS19b1 = JCM 16368]|uniref:Uncharacterized protein n=1 Tax=Mycolicibacterium aromaticivorans JS19b1 = JCM 16368 TaxID=1440774 RepID=A0A064CA58_9MYCO|nr:hypothetical protein [Mycolicibacterium aromaticivorans]KDE97200.1 hypothetical protein Y900_028430 [Mycolicibacterium aromaticivorans JS19b1 = JCM 16368]